MIPLTRRPGRLAVLALAGGMAAATAAPAQEPDERPAGRDLGAFTVTASPIEVLDANPLFTGMPVDALSARDVGGLDIHAVGRVGATADGVSALLVRVRVSGNARLDCSVEGGGDNGSCEALAVRASPPVAGTTTAVAIYRPPETFGQGAGPTPDRYRDAVETRDVTLRLALSGGGAATKTIRLARPPLVLVHGTFDEPGLWRNGTGGQAFDATVAAAGFKSFALDYAGDFLTRDNRNQATFSDNRQVLWERPGGIADALDFFRNELNLAATRADVIGHSLGGLIARIYASPGYAAPDHPYKRPDNFDAGDINRLVTLCTPHHGSVMSALLEAFHETKAYEQGLVASLLANITLALQRWWDGINTDGGAVRDQLPESPALKLIGPTPGYPKTSIPAFAVGCIASDEDADDFVMDPDGDYRKRFDDLSWLFYNAPEILRLYLVKAGMADEAAYLPWILDAGYREWLERTAEATGSWLFGPVELGETSPEKSKALQAIFRAFVFLYDENDFTVGLTSQHGGLGPDNRIDVRGVLHGPAPRYWTVQKRIIDVLKGESPGGQTFAAAGFPPAGGKVESAAPSNELIARVAAIANRPDSPPPADPRDRLISLVSLVTSDAYLWGDEAVRWSGVVYPHAFKFLDVADETQTIFMLRPVNPDSTPLIAGNASTKPMAIKAKSSDWGPHRGLLAADQAFSKKAGSPAATIAKYDCDAYDNLHDRPGELAPAGPTGVQALPFTMEVDGRSYELVRTEVSSGPLDAYQCTFTGKKYEADDAFAATLAGRLTEGVKPPLLLKGVDAEGNVEYRTLDDAPEPVAIPPEEALPFLVFANRDGQYMTADYDLLAIGARGRKCENPPFHETYGAACPWQIPLIQALNRAAGTAPCAYSGGDLVHHGPETQYSGSEYIDYPVLVVMPDFEAQPSRIVAVRQGPDGYRDMHIKRLFFMLQQQGWELDPNPEAVGWRWGPRNPFTGYDLRDQTTFPPDVPAELVPTGPLVKYCEF